MNPGFPQIGMDFAYGCFHYGMQVMSDIHFRIVVSGGEHVPRRGGFIVAGNHASVLDPPIAGGQLPRQTVAIARKTLWKGGLSSWWMDVMGFIPVDRDGGSDVGAIRRVVQLLKEEKGIGLFPEGTRTPNGRLQPPKAGVGLIACRTGVPVVPARLFGTFEALGRHGPLRLGTRVTIVFGRPLLPADFDDRTQGKERYQRASERIMAAIAFLEMPRPKVI